MEIRNIILLLLITFLVLNLFSIAIGAFVSPFSTSIYFISLFTVLFGFNISFNSLGKDEEMGGKIDKCCETILNKDFIPNELLKGIQECKIHIVENKINSYQFELNTVNNLVSKVNNFETKLNSLMEQLDYEEGNEVSLDGRSLINKLKFGSIYKRLEIFENNINLSNQLKLDDKLKNIEIKYSSDIDKLNSYSLNQLTQNEEFINKLENIEAKYSNQLIQNDEFKNKLENIETKYSSEFEKLELYSSEQLKLDEKFKNIEVKYLSGFDKINSSQLNQNEEFKNKLENIETKYSSEFEKLELYSSEQLKLDEKFKNIEVKYLSGFDKINSSQLNQNEEFKNKLENIEAKYSNKLIQNDELKNKLENIETKYISESEKLELYSSEQLKLDEKFKNIEVKYLSDFDKLSNQLNQNEEFKNKFKDIENIISVELLNREKLNKLAKQYFEIQNNINKIPVNLSNNTTSENMINLIKEKISSFHINAVTPNYEVIDNIKLNLLPFINKQIESLYLSRELGKNYIGAIRNEMRELLWRTTYVCWSYLEMTIMEIDPSYFVASLIQKYNLSVPKEIWNLFSPTITCGSKSLYIDAIGLLPRDQAKFFEKNQHFNKYYSMWELLNKEHTHKKIHFLVPLWKKNLSKIFYEDLSRKDLIDVMIHNRKNQVKMDFNIEEIGLSDSLYKRLDSNCRILDDLYAEIMNNKLDKLFLEENSN